MEVDPDTAHIKVKAVLEIEFLTDLQTLYLDLHSQKKNGKGMHVKYIVDECYKDTLKFEHKEDELRIQSIRFQKGYTTDLLIVYEGRPKDGLIFSKSKHGKPTIFADNWPNRAHHWLVCNDHPSDKAIWDIMVEHPKNYQVVSNGKFQISGEYFNDTKRTIYTTDYEIPTKVMVIGVADFAVDSAGFSGNIPVTSWVYPENKEKGFYDYAQAVEVLDWFVSKIAPYPYQKLANVQSKTIFGGMENAGCIFYFENSVTGKRNHEDLIAHEIAHQWFGNSASEKDWAHLWLSEGFATYLTDLYVLDKYGEEEFNKRLKKERNKAIAFSKRAKNPVVDPTDKLMSLLNAFSYQKGAWILHMLRQKLGPVVFEDVLKAYYKKYQFSNADTDDFFKVAEEVSKKNLQKFKEQWLYRIEHPKLKIGHKIKGKSIHLTYEQNNDEIFEFPLQFRFIGKKQSETFTIDVCKKTGELKYKARFKITDIEIDPNVHLFYERQ